MQHQYVCCGQSVSEHNSDRLEWNRLNYKVHDKVTVGGGGGRVYTQADLHSRLTLYQISSLS